MPDPRAVHGPVLIAWVTRQVDRPFPHRLKALSVELSEAAVVAVEPLQQPNYGAPWSSLLILGTQGLAAG
jgi:hypothetical protein